MKKALAMKCTQEDWDSIKHRIPKEYVKSIAHDEETYMVNNWCGFENNIATMYQAEYEGRFIHETFNAKIFLDACGIDCEPKYSITKLRLTQLLKNNEEGNVQLVSADLRAWFPDAFKNELEVNKWYFVDRIRDKSALVFFQGHHKETYGFKHGSRNWSDTYGDRKNTFCNPEYNYTEATPQEVEAALISEAKKRRFKKGIRYLSAWNNEAYCIYQHDLYYNAKKNCLATHNGNECVFQNGKWATIIQPEKMTLEQIEKELGRKIQIV